MAYSPSPTSPQMSRRSPTPPAQPLSKRDKRRNHHVALQQEYQANFEDNREQHYRSQLIALQQDMNLVTSADPYKPEPLEDAPDEISQLVATQASGTPYQSEMSSSAGRWYTEFVHEVNDAKQAKELALIELHRQHNAKLERLKYECDYRLHLAAKEAEHMKSTLRDRLIQSLTSRRQKLLKEKDQLDIADTNALLLHPSQFSITNPASPGGNHNSRKTRMTRHRGDHDDGSGNGNLEVGKGRKRKLAGDDDYGSPSRNGHITPADRAKTGNAAAQLDKAYSINQLFTEKELNLQSHQAQIATRHFFSSSQKENEVNGNGKKGREDEDDEDSDADDDEQPEATGMERTASQNVHVTRSTRNIGGMAGLNMLGDLAEKQQRRPTLPYATLHSAQGKNGMFLPPVGRLMDEEVEEDRIRIAEALKRDAGDVDQSVIEEALKPIAGARSNLAPDWPVYLDVHLVNIDPKQAVRS